MGTIPGWRAPPVVVLLPLQHLSFFMGVILMLSRAKLDPGKKAALATRFFLHHYLNPETPELFSCRSRIGWALHQLVGHSLAPVCGARWRGVMQNTNLWREETQSNQTWIFPHKVLVFDDQARKGSREKGRNGRWWRNILRFNNSLVLGT